MRRLLLFAALIGSGCYSHGMPYTPETWRAATTIAVGQKWSDAVAAVGRTGLEPHDASDLQILPATDGICFELPETVKGARGSGLVVHRDPQADTVSAIDWVESWNGPPASRVYHRESRFELPTIMQVQFARTGR